MSGLRADRRSPEAAAYRTLYKGKRWAALRASILVRDLYTCQRPGCGVLLIGKHPAPNSPVVNHRTPHKGDLRLFFDPANLEAVCKGCHDGDVKAEEISGYSSAIGADGWPTDPRHPANRG